MKTRDLLNLTEGTAPLDDETTQALLRINAALGSIKDQAAKYERLYQLHPDRPEFVEVLNALAQSLEDIATKG